MLTGRSLIGSLIHHRAPAKDVTTPYNCIPFTFQLKAISLKLHIRNNRLKRCVWLCMFVREKVWLCEPDGDNLSHILFFIHTIDWLENTFHIVSGSIFRLARVETVVSHKFIDDVRKTLSSYSKSIMEAITSVQN